MGAFDLQLPLVPTRLRINAAQYYRMAEVGIIAPDARVELIEGEVLSMAAIGTHHAAAVMRLNHLLAAAAGGHAMVGVQSPVRLDDLSEPEPDIALLRPRSDFYAERHPGPADVLLLVEVADSSARYDREIKLPLYARHGIPEVWIVDLDAGLFRRFRQPAGDEYRLADSTDRPGIVAVSALPQVAVDLGALLG